MKEQNKMGVHFSSGSDEWETPQDFFDMLERRFGKFELDPCCTKENAKCGLFFTKEDDGLTSHWEDYERIFVNPPYSKVSDWVKKCVEEATDERLVVMLVPARTDTKWFHEHVMPNATEVLFVKGRLKFSGSKNSAPFPSMVVVFDYLNPSSTVPRVATIGRKYGSL
tara:strand:+ start:1057 stop:1557 length:501 start_codon:yes stop_codon:yes gene_type:complete